MQSFRDRVRVVAEVPSGLEAAFVVVGTPYVFASPSRLAAQLRKASPIRIIPFDPKVLLPKLWPRDPRLLMQWAQTHQHDPGHSWFRGLVRKVAGKIK